MKKHNLFKFKALSFAILCSMNSFAQEPIVPDMSIDELKKEIAKDQEVAKEQNNFEREIAKRKKELELLQLETELISANQEKNILLGESSNSYSSDGTSDEPKLTKENFIKLDETYNALELEEDFEGASEEMFGVYYVKDTSEEDIQSRIDKEVNERVRKLEADRIINSDKGKNSEIFNGKGASDIINYRSSTNDNSVGLDLPEDESFVLTSSEINALIEKELNSKAAQEAREEMVKVETQKAQEQAELELLDRQNKLEIEKRKRQSELEMELARKSKINALIANFENLTVNGVAYFDFGDDEKTAELEVFSNSGKKEFFSNIKVGDTFVAFGMFNFEVKKMTPDLVTFEVSAEIEGEQKTRTVVGNFKID